jgi:hypothetical protein
MKELQWIEKENGFLGKSIAKRSFQILNICLPSSARKSSILIRSSLL